MKAKGVVGSSLSLLEAINRGEVPQPPLINQQMWLRWRRDHGRRPARKGTREASTTIKEEMKLCKEAMAKYHGGDWQEKLFNAEPQEDEEDGDDSHHEETAIDVFHRPRGSQESVAEHDARRLRAGKILLETDPDMLSETDKVSSKSWTARTRRARGTP